MLPGEVHDAPSTVPLLDVGERQRCYLRPAAFRADITGVFSMVMARELSGRSYANIGVPGNHHLISHHRNDAQLMAQKAKIDTYHVQMLGYFLERMRSTPDGDGSLLDHSLILFGSGMVTILDSGKKPHIASAAATRGEG